MSVRLFVEPEQLATGQVRVQGDDHHYLFRVRRLRVGDAVLLLDGQGRQATARVVNVAAEVAILETDAAEMVTTPRLELTVLLALIKGDRTEWAIQKLVELGVTRVIPMQTERTVVRLDAKRAGSRRQRFESVARDAARQCRRADVPTIAEVMELERALAAGASAEARFIAWAREGEQALEASLRASRPRSVAIAIGPEGGFASRELEAAVAAGYLPVSLGPRVLRAETAAVVSATIAGVVVGDLGV